MPKQKTHKALCKRFKVTARGKVQFRRAGSRHLKSTKSAKRRRKLRKWVRPDGLFVEKKILKGLNLMPTKSAKQRRKLRKWGRPDGLLVEKTVLKGSNL